MSRRRFFASTAGALAVAASTRLASPATARSTDARIVNANGVRLRSAPGTGASVVASLASGTVVRYLAYGGWANGYDWHKVRVESTGREGFVAASFLSPPDSSGGGFAIGAMVHADTSGGGANLRNGPGTGYGVVAVIRNGTTGTVTDGPAQANGYTWYRVNFGNVAGWMATAVLAVGGGNDRSTVRVADGPLNVRSQPGLGGAIVGTAATGATGFVTTEMPRDANGYTWVNVQFNSGLRGWVARNFLAWT
jgi:uncharacterized protein YraI